MAKQNKDMIKVIVKPATDNAFREGYAKANGKVIPFDVPVYVTKNDLIVLERIKEPRVVDNSVINPRKIMDDLMIPQEKANKIARMRETQEMNKGVRYVNKYSVKVI